MKKYIDSIKKRIKPVFMIAVLILVIVEFRRINKEISYDTIKDILAEISIPRLLIMVLIGFMSIIPTINYDRTLNRSLNQDFPKAYIWQTSFTINTFNNLIGFGGIISMGLRSSFYKKENDTKNLVKHIFEIFLYMPVGISIYSLLALILVAIDKSNFTGKYWLWFLGGGLYFPLMYFFSKEEGENFPQKYKKSLALTSIMEWCGVFVTFMSIGYLMNLSFNPIRVFPIVVCANIIGYISMIPGAIGSFDLIVLLGLTGLGINHDAIILWILLYRISYYILPFFLGLIFFVKNFAKAFEKRGEIFIVKLIRNISLTINAFMMYIFSLFMILSATIPDKISDTSKFLGKINPVRASIIYQFPSILLGFIFIVLARALLARTYKAYKITLAFLVMTLLYAFILQYGLITHIYILLMIFLTIVTRKDLTSSQFLYAKEDKIMDFIITSFMLIVYASKIIKANKLRIDAFSKKNDFLIIPFEGRLLKIFISLLLIYFIVFLLSRYLAGKKEKLGENIDLERVKVLLENYNNSMESSLVLLKDKDIYYYKDDQGIDRACLQVATVGDRLIVMGNPIGDDKYFDLLLANFVNDADRLGYNVVFYEINQETTMKLHEYGYNFMKFGENAIVNLCEFSLDGKTRKNLRKTINKIDRQGYKFEVIDKPYSREIMDRLREISEIWLDGRKERGFSLGFFDEDYLNMGKIALVKDDTDNIIAFANLMPIYKKDFSSIDLMRYDKNHHLDGLMDYLFVNLFLYFKDQGYKYFDLGMAPLANVGTMKHSFIEEKLVYLVYKFGNYFYSFEGLRQYKEKYANERIPRYTSYSHGSSLVFSELSLMLVDTRKIEKR